MGCYACGCDSLSRTGVVSESFLRPAAKTGTSKLKEYYQQPMCNVSQIWVTFEKIRAYSGCWSQGNWHGLNNRSARLFMSRKVWHQLHAASSCCRLLRHHLCDMFCCCMLIQHLVAAAWYCCSSKDAPCATHLLHRIHAVG